MMINRVPIRCANSTCTTTTSVNIDVDGVLYCELHRHSLTVKLSTQCTYRSCPNDVLFIDEADDTLWCLSHKEYYP